MNDDRTPLVSIVCLTYNHTPYIRECLDGFLMQKTDFPIEVIIHDDASTDGTTDIVREYASKYPEIIKPIIQTENQYSKHHDFSKVIYECLIKCKGKYIALCEGDDYWIDSVKLKMQVNYLESSDDISMCYTKTRYYYQETLKFKSDTFGGPYTSLKDLISHPYCIPTATIVVEKDLYLDVLNKYILQNKWKMADFPLSLSIALESKIAFINKETAVYRVLKSSACHFSEIETDLSFLSNVYDVKRYFIKRANLDISEMELMELYNRDIWYRGIAHNNFEIAKRHSQLCKSVRAKDYILKLLCSNFVLFKLIKYLRK